MICIPIIEDNVRDVLVELEKADEVSDMVEVRLDYIKNVSEDDVRAIAEWKRKPVIFACRPPIDGGKQEIPEEKRISLLLSAVKHGADFVDIEHRTKNIQEVLAKIKELNSEREEPTRVIVSFHDFEKTPPDDELNRIMSLLTSLEPDIVKIAVKANTIEDNFRLFDLMEDAPLPIIGLCMGEFGSISRILYNKFGGYLTFASRRKGKESGPGQLSVSELRELYKIGLINQDTEIYGIIGDPVEHSLSPVFHNNAFKYFGMNKVYVKFHVTDLNSFIDIMKDFDIKGCSVTVPYKEKVMESVDDMSENAKAIGAINTIVNNDGKLMGYNTDWSGAMAALKENIILSGKKSIVFGAGGASRAVCYGLLKEGCDVTITNRTDDRAQKLAKERGCQWMPFSDFKKLKKLDADLLVNATTLGMEESDEKIISDELLSNIAVFDLVSSSLKTPLLKCAQKQGCKIVEGYKMLLYQGTEQFQLWTHKTPPLLVTKDTLYRELKFRRK